MSFSIISPNTFFKLQVWNSQYKTFRGFPRLVFSYFRFLGRKPPQENANDRSKGKISHICREPRLFKNFTNCEKVKYLQKIVIIYFNVIITLNIHDKYLILMKVGSLIILLPFTDKCYVYVTESAELDAGLLGQYYTINLRLTLSTL